MGRARDFVVGLLAGAAAGGLVLGVGGRVAMRLIALAAGQSPGFSLGGTLEVLATGALYGGAAGLFHPLLARLGTRWRWSPGLGLGVVAFTFAALTSRAARGAAGSVPGLLPLVFGLFGALCVAYGLTVHALAARWQARRGPS